MLWSHTYRELRAKNMALNLLFIENGDYFRDIIGGRLRRKDFSFFSAGQLGETKKIIARNPIDVGLVDLSSLKIEGVRIIEEIKRLRPRVEIITINTYDQLINSIDAMKAGVFDDFLIPVEINALIDRIQAAGLQKKEKEKQRRPILKQFQDAMTAVSFAEAGELEIAEMISETGKITAKKRK
jgi:DNA-binding NtrC family response regulator